MINRDTHIINTRFYRDASICKKHVLIEMLSFAAAAAVAKAEAIRTRPTTATRRLSNRRTSLR